MPRRKDKARRIFYKSMNRRRLAKVLGVKARELTFNGVYVSKRSNSII